jgi:DNA-binding CsgD family transcriptional regulator
MTSMERRFTPWLDLVAELVRQPGHDFPHRLFMRLLADTFDESVGWNEFGPANGYVLEILDSPPGWPGPELVNAWVSHAHEHPLLRWHLLTGRRTAMTTSRVPRSLVTPQGEAAIREYLLPYGLDEQLAIPCDGAAGTLRAFVLSRTGTDFTDEDLLLAQRVQSLLALLARQVDVLGANGVVHSCDLGLTGRERAILSLLDCGLTANAIGHRLAISPRTVHTHLRNIYRKLGVADRLLACRVAHEAGLLQSGVVVEVGRS